MRSLILKDIASRPPSRGIASMVADDMLALSSHGSTVLGVDESEMSVSCVISTPDQDRTGDVVICEGCDLTHYRTNPVVCLFHQKNERFPFPVGKAEGPDGRCTVRIIPGQQITSKNYFSQTDEDAYKAFGLIAEGIFRGVSIGFNPLDEPERIPSQYRGGKKGYLYRRWELIEITHTPVGMNQFAVVIRSLLERDRTQHGKLLTPMIRKGLIPYAAKRPVQLFKEGSPMTTVNKAMGESSATAGGATVPPGDEMAGKCMKDIADIGEYHMGAAGMEGHALHYHPESKTVHHSYPDETDPEEYKSLRQDLYGVDGVDDVEHGPNPGPEEEPGWQKAFPPLGEDEDVPAADKVPDKSKKDPKGETGQEIEKSAASIRKLVARMPRRVVEAYRMTVRKANKDVRKKVEARVPMYLKAGLSRVAAVAAACFKLKEFDPDDMETKGDGDGDADDMGDMPEVEEGLDMDDEPADEGTDEPADVLSERGRLPLGGQKLQSVIENLETDLNIVEQEKAKQWLEDALEEGRALFAELYPGFDAGGATGGTENMTPEEETADKAATDAVMDHYADVGKAWTRQRVLTYGRVMKRMAKKYCDVVKDAADHLGELSEMAPGEKWLQSHARNSGMHCKALTDLEGKMRGASEVEGEGDPEEIEGAPVKKDVLDLDRIEKALENVTTKQDELNKSRFRLTGVRA